ncbi:MAG: hypothetical protein JW384_03460 [Nitrosomonadaceae bacterium]|nr:hypothetical protein [Nitrosomonadaceae bacterium]
MSTHFNFTIYGEPASKSNSRRIVRRGKHIAVIKSSKALSYLDAFKIQCPKPPKMLEGDLVVTMTIYYASRRPDLDESLILDAMQGFIYLNDRQVKERHTYWGLDKENPRAEILVESIGGATNSIDHGNNEANKEQLLWRKVITSNMRDLLKATVSKKLKMVEWYTTKEFKQVCKLAGLYYGDVQKVAVDIVSDDTPDPRGILETFESLVMQS